MPQPPAVWYSYAVVRVVPRPERGEFVNVGVVLFARTARFLATRVAVDRARLRALAPDLDLAAVERHLAAFAAVADGAADGGPIAALPPSERFHWLTAPRSTMIQPSPVHIGCCDDPAAALHTLFAALVAPPSDDEASI
jgi:hypothetical protein